MDEPTNHLDFTMLTWLEDYLSSYKGSVLIVSHDRYFLDKVADNICEIENGSLYKYKGGYSAFLTQKEERIRHAEKEYEKQQSELAAMRDYVAKNLAKSSSSNSVGSRVKALEKWSFRQSPTQSKRKSISNLNMILSLTRWCSLARMSESMSETPQPASSFMKTSLLRF